MTHKGTKNISYTQKVAYFAQGNRIKIAIS